MWWNLDARVGSLLHVSNHAASVVPGKNEILVRMRKTSGPTVNVLYKDKNILASNTQSDV